MKIIIIIAFFLPLLIHCFKQKDWYLCLLFGLYPILPDWFAIEITDRLPLLSASRILILLNLVITLAKNRGKIKKKFPRVIWGYFIASAMVIAINIGQYSGGIAELFILIFEQLALVWIIIENIQDKNDVNKYLALMTAGFTISCIIGLIQTVFNYDISSVLRIVTDRNEFGLSPRMGMIRAYGTTGSAIFFASECAFMILIGLFLYENTKNRKYLLFIMLCIMTLVCTMSRSSVLSLGIVMLIIVIRYFSVFLNKYLKYIAFAFGLLIILCFSSKKVMSIVGEPVKSVMNILGADFTISEDFGANANNAKSSRLFQWTAVKYMSMNDDLVFGYGYKAYVRGKIHFYYKSYSSWDVAGAIDVGFVNLIAERGIVGFAIYVIFLLCMIVKSFKKQKLDTQNKKINFYSLTRYIIYLYILNNVLTACLDMTIIWLIVGLFAVYDMKNNSERIQVKNGFVYNCYNL